MYEGLQEGVENLEITEEWVALLQKEAASSICLQGKCGLVLVVARRFAYAKILHLVDLYQYVVTPINGLDSRFRRNDTSKVKRLERERALRLLPDIPIPPKS